MPVSMVNWRTEETGRLGELNRLIEETNSKRRRIRLPLEKCWAQPCFSYANMALGLCSKHYQRQREGRPLR